MTDPLTTRIGMPQPQSTDNVSQGPAEFQAIEAIVDALWGLDFTDFLSAGVTGRVSNQNASGPTINSGTGAITFTLNSDRAWISLGGVLTRTAVPTNSVILTPSSLPTSGNYRNVGLFIAPGATWGSAGTLSVAVGSSQGSQAAALANPPSTPSNTMLLQYVIVTNSSGTYSISTTSDQRTSILALGGPTGSAGGALAGSYPSPTLAAGAAAANLGTAGGDVNGSTWPNLVIAASAVTAAKIASGAAASNVGSLGGDLSGSLPNPSIGASKVTNSKIAASVPFLDLSSIGAAGRGSIQVVTSAPNPAGPNGAPFSYTESGITFPTACLIAGSMGYQNYSDAGHTASASPGDISWNVTQSGQHVQVSFLNVSGANRYPYFYIWAIGY